MESSILEEVMQCGPRLSEFYEYVKRGEDDGPAGLAALAGDLRIARSAAQRYGQLLSELKLIDIFEGRQETLYSVSLLGYVVPADELGNITGMTPDEFMCLKSMYEMAGSMKRDVTRASETRGASDSLQSLADKGYLELHLTQLKGGPWMYSLTEHGREIARKLRCGRRVDPEWNKGVGRGMLLFLQNREEIPKLEVMSNLDISARTAGRYLCKLQDKEMVSRKRKVRKDFSLTEKGEKTAYFWSEAFPVMERTAAAIYDASKRYPALMGYLIVRRLRLLCALSDEMGVNTEFLGRPHDLFFTGWRVQKRLMDNNEYVKRLNTAEKMEREAEGFECIKPTGSIYDQQGYFIRLGTLLGWAEQWENKGNDPEFVYQKVESNVPTAEVRKLRDIVLGYHWKKGIGKDKTNDEMPGDHIEVGAGWA